MSLILQVLLHRTATDRTHIAFRQPGTCLPRPVRTRHLLLVVHLLHFLLFPAARLGLCFQFLHRLLLPTALVLQSLPVLLHLQPGLFLLHPERQCLPQRLPVAQPGIGCLLLPPELLRLQGLQLRATSRDFRLFLFFYLPGFLIRRCSLLTCLGYLPLLCPLVDLLLPAILRHLKRPPNLVGQGRERLHRLVHRHLLLHPGEEVLARRQFLPATVAHPLQPDILPVQDMILLSQPGQFLFRRADALLQSHLLGPLETHVSRTVPILQQRLVAPVAFRLHPFRHGLERLSGLLLCQYQLLLVSHPFPQILPLLQFLAECRGLCRRLRLFRLQHRQLFVAQQHDAARLCLQFLQLGLFFGLHHIDFPADARIDFRAREFLQDVRFLFLLALEELGKLSLRQQRGPAELLESEADAPFNLRPRLRRLVGERGTVLQGKGPHHFLDFSTRLVARPCHAPHRPQSLPRGIREPQFHLRRHTVAPHQHAGIVDAHTFRLPRETVVLVLIAFVGRLFQAGRGVVKGQAHRIQQRGLARSRRSANQEDGILAQRPVCKVNARLLDGSNIFDNEFL